MKRLNDCETEVRRFFKYVLPATNILLIGARFLAHWKPLAVLQDVWVRNPFKPGNILFLIQKTRKEDKEAKVTRRASIKP